MSAVIFVHFLTVIFA